MLKITSWVQMLARCPECLAANQILVNYERPRTMHKCQSCSNIFPLGRYRVFMSTNDSNNPLW